MENLEVMEIIFYICNVLIKFFEIMENFDSLQTAITAVVSAIVALVTSIIKNRKKGGKSWDVDEEDVADVRNFIESNVVVYRYEMLESDNNEKPED